MTTHEQKPISIDQDGIEIFVGDFVCFKDGIEQYGKAIARDGLALEIECHDDMTGEKFTRVVNRFWKEG